MNSSGIKRGLAGSAITALAITGLPFLATSAQAAHGTAEVTLISQGAAGNDASVKNDGQDTTVRLEAEVADPANPVTFQYNTGNPDQWINIATVTANDNGYASFEWAAANLVGATVKLRAQVTKTVAGAPTEFNSDRSDVTIFGPGAAAESVNITAGNTKGVFQEPYSETAGNERNVIVDGTTSSTDTADSVSLYWWKDADDSKNGTTATPVKVAKDATSGTFSGVVNVDGFDFSGNPDEIAFGAELDTDDVEAFALYNQEIGSVQADPTSGTVAGAGTKDIVVTVLDQNNAPIAGAEVRKQDGTVVGYTNGAGKVTASQAGGTTSYYYANATDSNPYEAGLGDKKSEDVTVGQYNPQASSLEATSANGSAFDYDEYDGDDIQVQVQDQQGEDFSTAQTVEYSWTFTAFDGDPAGKDLNDPNGTAIAVNGKADIPLPVQAEGGTYVLSAALRANPASGQGAVAMSELLTVKAGQADIKFDDAEESAPAGTKEDVAGKLVLEDGTGLGGRPITLTYAGGNAGFDQPTGPDQATRTVKTAADGTFSATLEDPADPAGTPQSTETGTITAVTDDYADPNTPADTDNANDSSTTKVVFSQAAAPADSKVTIGGEIAANPVGKPGVAQGGTVTVVDKAGAPVKNTLVTLTVDGQSFFTDGSADPAKKQGDDTGELKSLGQSITVVTDNAGKASFQVAIEKSAEFNDDGLAEDVVTASTGGATDTEDVDYSSAAPLNGGEVKLVLADDRFQESGVLPKAPLSDDVAYDVMVTDQFGNPVGGEAVAITADNGGDVSNNAVVTDFQDNVEFFLSSDSEADVTPTGTWTAPFSEYGTGPGFAPVTGTRAITGDGQTISFYEVDFANSTYTLEQQGPENRPVGSTVIMDYTALDQNGEPIEFVVNFFRTGPDEFGNGEANNGNFTGEDGRTSYVFQGASEGTATVTAIGFDNGEAVPESQVTDTVTFGPGEPENPNDPDAPIIINISGDDNGGSKDVVRALVTNGEAETIKLFKIRGKVKDGNRRLKKVREDVVPEGGNLTFKVADRNGNKKTRFIAKVSRDAQDGPENFKSNTQKIR